MRSSANVSYVHFLSPNERGRIFIDVDLREYWYPFHACQLMPSAYDPCAP